MSSQKRQKPQSYLSSHPHLAKRITSTPSQISKLQIPQQQYNRLRNQFYEQQQSMSVRMKNKIEILEHENDVVKQSLHYFDAKAQFQQLQRQLQAIKQQDVAVSQQITHCQIIQQNTTPEEYFLFKKNKRLETFNQAMDQLFEEANAQKQAMKQFFDQVKTEIISVKKEINQMENQLRPQPNRSNQNQSNSSQQDKNDQSRVNVTLQQSIKQSGKFMAEQADSDSGSSVDCSQLQKLKQQYKSLLQTYQIISQNNEIMTTQLFNNIQSIQQTLNKYYQHQKTKLFRDIMQVKQDFQYMPIEHIIPPTETELKYDVAPLMLDYKNRMVEIGKKLSSDLKSITSDILMPLRWETVNFDEYLDVTMGELNRSNGGNKSRKDSQRETKSLKQTQKEFLKIQEQIKKEDQQISQLQTSLQDIMGQTMIYKQKQHELELAMNNMRKMLRQQQKIF